MKISVITVNYNDAAGLKKTLDSVAAQKVKPYEMIVIDGASSDDSVQVIQDGSSIITFWSSEPDAGIYNAMNKGVAQAHGDRCLFLNSGDSFCDESVIEKLSNLESDADVICGNVTILEDTPRVKKAPEEITLRFLYNESLCHQGALIRTSLLWKYPYDETLKIVADRKFFLQTLVLDNGSFAAVDINIADYDIHGVSAKHRFESQEEWHGVLCDLLPERIMTDYGRDAEGALYGTTAYERMFLEIGRRRYRNPVYRIVRGVLAVISLFVPSARFVRLFPRRIR
ncbi:MAG: glycosyltransferase [Bacteroidales bacterium]|nr:glycosyltransferase [Bacteroidales bacterium]